MKNKLDIMINENVFKDRYIILFGANNPGDEVISYLSKNNVMVDAIIDNNPINSGKKLLDVPIYKPNDLLKDYKENLLVLICSSYYFEMRAQLEKMGYIADKHIIRILDMNVGIEYSIEEDMFHRNLEFIFNAMKTYEAIQNKYGENKFIFLNPIRANGDVYITCRYLESYLEKFKINNYVLVVIGNGCYNVARLFGINNVEVVNQNEMDLLVRLQRFLRSAQIRIMTVQPYIMYTNFLNNIDGYKGLNFNDFFKYSLFELDDISKAKTPNIIYDGNKLKKLIKEFSLVKGKTVIISPYANSIPKLSWKFWINLVKRLNEAGYKVFTNSVGEREEIIPNTEPLFIDFFDIIDVLEYAGIFIGIRSGLCDILSTAKCKKIILYPDKACGFGKVIDVYGIRNMGFSEDIIEIEADDNIEVIIEQVLKNI
ncbi:hypothetical protein B0P06_003371 [Clostridium saccharoperbutylacetonicum]|nr:hypothetical protein [Clostridium saccharoperbutylacetonicum]NSB43600.1 hypothetical protein [Clostridium saccharoperbutylacetonicum]